MNGHKNEPQKITTNNDILDKLIIKKEAILSLS